MAISTEQLLTLMRPLRVSLESALEPILKDEPDLPTHPVPRLQAAADGSGAHWVDVELDPASLVRAAMPRLRRTGHLRIAELILARELGLDVEGAPSAVDLWTPQRAVIEVFLQDYLLEGSRASDDSPLDDPFDLAFQMQVERLHAFLSTTEFTGQLIAVIGGVTLPVEELSLDPVVSLVRFRDEWRDQLWRIAGWGSTAPQPLQVHEFHDVSHVISVDVGGERLGGWDWAAAQEKARRARRALLLAGAISVREGVSWLRHDERFASYLAALVARDGVMFQPLTSSISARSSLIAADAAQLPALYAALDRLPDSSRLNLALRRLEVSSERTTAEDRLIDLWVAFESLFTADSQGELSYRASLRIARYVGRDLADRRRIFDGLRRSYAWRSQLVHGTDPAKVKTSKLGSLEEAVTLCERTLRQALSKTVLTGEPPLIADIDHAFLA